MSTTQWPKQTHAELTKFYGPVTGLACTQGRVILPFPFPLAWDQSQKVRSASCHVKVAEPMTRIWTGAAQHYGEKEFRRLRLDQWGGCYAPRKMRGGSSWSTHAWGMAWDVDPERNQLKWGRDKASLDGAAYEAFWKIVEAEGAVSLGRVRNFDWMHFQFARL